MKPYTWYDFEKLTRIEQKDFLVRIKPIAEKDKRVDLILYNKYAERFGLERIKPVF
jgi:hypothetical protein